MKKNRRDKMKKKNGFIAVSLIYSFFLLFLMIMLASATKSTQNRQLLKVFKDDLQEQLNKEEFITTTLENRTYVISEEISFADETWQVIEDKGNSVVLILKRSLSQEEITSALGTNASNATYFAGTCNNSECRVKMCLNGYNSAYCFYENTTSYNYYTWNNSIAKMVLERWFEQNVYLQQICRYQYDETLKDRICKKDTLIRMTFSDGTKNHQSYIRLATNNEAIRKDAWINSGSNSWTLTLSSRTNGKSNLFSLNGVSYTNENTLTLRPVIEVRKN